MKAINKCGQFTSFKMLQVQKKKENNFKTSNSKNDFSTKTKYNSKEEEKIVVENINNKSNINKNGCYPLHNYIFNYNYIPKDQKNNFYKTEKYSIKDDYSCEEKERKPYINDSSLNKKLNKSNTNFKTKLSLSDKKRKGNKLSLSLFSLNYINNKLHFNHKIKIEDENQKEKSDTLSLSSLHQKTISNYHKKHINKNNLKKKSFKFLTEVNNNFKKKSHKNLLHKTSASRNEINNNLLFSSKNNSYDGTKKIISKINNSNKDIRNNESNAYIKVNIINTKNKENQIKNLKENIKINLYNSINNNININETIRVVKVNQNTENKNKIQKLKKNSSKKVINNNNDYYYYKMIQNQKNKNNIKNIFDINISENNNIFLDKNYQTRFNQKPKINKIKNDIFTSKNQKEYNTLIVKKKSSNHLNKNNLVTISTTNSSNSSNNNNTTNNKRNWVHRLYDEEIKKQKMRDKMIYLLRKSILSEASPIKQKKELNFENKIKKFDNYKKNLDDNFNIINLFISDEKKLKNKKLNKYEDFPNYKRDNYDNDNDKNIIRDEKIKIIENKKRKKIKHRKSNSKKFLLLYNEELINEEDEEKEKDEDE